MQIHYFITSLFTLTVVLILCYWSSFAESDAAVVYSSVRRTGDVSYGEISIRTNSRRGTTFISLQDWPVYQAAVQNSLCVTKLQLLLFSQFWLKSQNSGKNISLRIKFFPWIPTRILTLFHNSEKNSDFFPEFGLFPGILTPQIRLFPQ